MVKAASRVSGMALTRGAAVDACSLLATQGLRSKVIRHHPAKATPRDVALQGTKVAMAQPTLDVIHQLWCEHALWEHGGDRLGELLVVSQTWKMVESTRLPDGMKKTGLQSTLLYIDQRLLKDRKSVV